MNSFKINHFILLKYQEKHLNIEEKMQALQNEIEDAKMELNRVFILKILFYFLLLILILTFKSRDREKK